MLWRCTSTVFSEIASTPAISFDDWPSFVALGKFLGRIPTECPLEELHLDLRLVDIRGLWGERYGRFTLLLSGGWAAILCH